MTSGPVKLSMEILKRRQAKLGSSLVLVNTSNTQEMATILQKKNTLTQTVTSGSQEVIGLPTPPLDAHRHNCTFPTLL